MKTISQGKIFVSDQRGTIQNKHLTRHSTFSNSEHFFNPVKEPIGNLYALHDDMLAPMSSYNFYTQEKGYIILLPVTGTLNYLDDQENETEIEIGQSLTIFLEKNTFVKLTNPFESHTINYVVIGIKAQESAPTTPMFSEVDLSKLNHLHCATPNFLPFKISLGQFNGRGSTEYFLNSTAIFYAFVLSGAFEIDGRLLHDRDGIALWETETIEMEALSNYATLIAIELCL
ncbi:hypothetical protein [Pedobacter sp. SL55]|uniref:pirin family protein n=1 Tax=Pedobacter sp. SL55 TaxID=2995161 RepID=UPI0022720BD5|nr:hypothetical protein [Pedobacter sp. SL55]WAC42175.1 hypothetical protein OVA16_07425 [Pedobacter sp. SL55]